MTGDAQFDRGKRGAEEREGRESIEGPRLDRRLAQRHGVRRRDEHIPHGKIMTASTAHPHRVPGIEDFARRSGKTEHAHDRHAVRAKARLTAIDDPAATDEPLCVLTSASEWPPPG